MSRLLEAPRHRADDDVVANYSDQKKRKKKNKKNAQREHEQERHRPEHEGRQARRRHQEGLIIFDITMQCPHAAL